MAMPWWLQRSATLCAPALDGLPLEVLFHLREQLQQVRDNVVLAELDADFAAFEGSRARWAAFEAREAGVHTALRASADTVATAVRTGRVGPAAFRAHWQGLGYLAHADGAGTPADDWLDALLELSAWSAFRPPAAHALLNLASRASRIADLLTVAELGEGDLLFDLGSGSGKVAVTVAASSECQVRGVEIDATYSAAARHAASALGLERCAFDTADARDVDLRAGTHFFLYYPFHGAVARTVAHSLGALAREKDISLYVIGPALDFGQFFLEQVAGGALSLTGRRGEFGEVMMLASAR